MPLKDCSAPPTPWWAPRRAPAFQAAVAVTLPLAIGASAGAVGAGAVASLGALAALYVHALPLRQRAVRVATVGAGLVLAVAIGTAGSTGPTAGVVAVVVVAIGAALWSRLRSVPPPGAFMPVLACATATRIPLGVVPAADRLVLVALGAAGAWCVAMAGALRWWDRRSPYAVAAPHAVTGLSAAVRAAARIGLGTGIAAALATGLGLPRPDWAAAACAAVLVHDRTRATVSRAGHRAVGTAAGIGLAGILIVVGPGVLATVALVACLQFAVELVVVRDYRVAVVLITPLALLLGELATGASGTPPGPLLMARLLETAIGCAAAVAAQLLIPPPGEEPLVRRLRRGRAVAATPA